MYLKVLDRYWFLSFIILLNWSKWSVLFSCKSFYPKKILTLNMSDMYEDKKQVKV